MRFCAVVIEAHTCFLWAFLLLVLPLRWMAAFFLAATVHELFHFFVLFLFHKPVLQLRIGPGGMKMQIPELSYVQEFFCALAGPLGGFLLLFLYNWYPELAVCALVQSCYNLLPIYPLDGGRAIRCLMNIIFPNNAQSISKSLEIVVFVGILFVCVKLKWSILAICMGYLTVVKLLPGKIPCKPSFLGVQ